MTSLPSEIRALADAARTMLSEIDRKLDTERWPVKYGVPFGAALELHKALDAYDSRVASGFEEMEASRG